MGVHFENAHCATREKGGIARTAVTAYPPNPLFPAQTIEQHTSYARHLRYYHPMNAPVSEAPQPS